MRSHDVSERYQNNNLKAVVSYSNLLSNRSLKEISKKDDILFYIQTKVKCKDDWNPNLP
jgi:DNA-binding ferritin-like protein